MKWLMLILVIGFVSCVPYRPTPHPRYEKSYYPRESAYDRYKEKQLRDEQLRYYRSQNYK